MSEGLTSGQVGVSKALPPEPTVLELEDLLYDILASGADPSLPAGTLEAVQTFLHEHARSKHTQAEFVAFFTSHNLSMVRDTGFGLSLPPMDLRAPMRVPEPVVEPEAPTQAAPRPVALPLEPDPIEVAPVAIAPAPRRSRALDWAFAAAALAAISGGAIYAITAQAELERVRAEQRATAETLARVQTELTRLRGSVEQSKELSRNADHKTELLLRSLVSPLDPAQR
jgi:hypothetical protein